MTNGVHTPTWDSRWADAVWTEACGKDRWRVPTDLRDEHERQREELARITREANSSDDRITLAFAIEAFVCDVVLDMSLEEARLPVVRGSD